MFVRMWLLSANPSSSWSELLTSLTSRGEEGPVRNKRRIFSSSQVEFILFVIDIVTAWDLFLFLLWIYNDH